MKTITYEEYRDRLIGLDEGVMSIEEIKARNLIIDAETYGGNIAKKLTIEEREELKDWRKWEKILLEHPEWKLQLEPTDEGR